MKRVNIAILGLGVVGGGTYEIICQNHDQIEAAQGLDVRVARILERNAARLSALSVPAGVGTQSFDDIVNDPDISIVVETMGGIEPAKSFITAALSAGKSVVTANKELIAKHGNELQAAAKKSGAGLYFEASCVGGVPVIRALDLSMQANNVLELVGIINGTTNYILTRMTESGADYASALSEAQKMGYAEANPASDVEGFDAAYKLSILSSLAYGISVPVDSIFREGISSVTAADIEYARQLGFVIKLLAISKRREGKIEAHVHPCLVPAEHPLAGIRNSYNAVYLVGDHVGDLMFYGKGAGAHPTGSAIVSDIIYCAGNKHHKYYLPSARRGGALSNDFRSRYYIRIHVVDKPGTASKVTNVLGRCNVSLEQIIQKGSDGDTAPVIYLTHTTTEKAMRKALEGLKKLDAVLAVDNVIRVL